MSDDSGTGLVSLQLHGVYDCLKGHLAQTLHQEGLLKVVPELDAIMLAFGIGGRCKTVHIYIDIVAIKYNLYKNGKHTQLWLRITEQWNFSF